MVNIITNKGFYTKDIDYFPSESFFFQRTMGRTVAFFGLFFLSFNSLHLLLLDNEVSSSPRHHRRGLFSFTDNDYKTVSPREVSPLVVTESSDAAVTHLNADYFRTPNLKHEPYDISQLPGCRMKIEK